MQDGISRPFSGRPGTGTVIEKSPTPLGMM